MSEENKEKLKSRLGKFAIAEIIVSYLIFINFFFHFQAEAALGLALGASFIFGVIINAQEELEIYSTFRKLIIFIITMLASFMFMVFVNPLLLVLLLMVL